MTVNQLAYFVGTKCLVIKLGLRTLNSRLSKSGVKVKLYISVKVIMKKITLLAFIILSLSANASDWFLDKVLSEKIESCMKDNGVFGEFSKQTSSTKHCLSYTCVARHKDKIYVGKTPIKFDEVGVLTQGELCTDDASGLSYLLSRFERLKESLDYYLCYSKCSEDFSSKKCSRCLEKNDDLRDCSISSDHQRIECPNAVYKIDRSVNSTLRGIIKENHSQEQKSNKSKSTSTPQ